MATPGSNQRGNLDTGGAAGGASLLTLARRGTPELQPDMLPRHDERVGNLLDDMIADGAGSSEGLPQIFLSQGLRTAPQAPLFAATVAEETLVAQITREMAASNRQSAPPSNGGGSEAPPSGGRAAALAGGAAPFIDPFAQMAASFGTPLPAPLEAALGRNTWEQSGDRSVSEPVKSPLQAASDNIDLNRTPLKRSPASALAGSPLGPTPSPASAPAAAPPTTPLPPAQLAASTPVPHTSGGQGPGLASRQAGSSAGVSSGPSGPSGPSLPGQASATAGPGATKATGTLAGTHKEASDTSAPAEAAARPPLAEPGAGPPPGPAPGQPESGPTTGALQQNQLGAPAAGPASGQPAAGHPGGLPSGSAQEVVAKRAAVLASPSLTSVQKADLLLNAHAPLPQPPEAVPQGDPAVLAYELGQVEAQILVYGKIFRNEPLEPELLAVAVAERPLDLATNGPGAREWERKLDSWKGVQPPLQAPGATAGGTGGAASGAQQPPAAPAPGGAPMRAQARAQVSAKAAPAGTVRALPPGPAPRAPGPNGTAPAAPAQPPSGAQPKKRVGRPLGSKNKPKALLGGDNAALANQAFGKLQPQQAPAQHSHGHPRPPSQWTAASQPPPQHVPAQQQTYTPVPVQWSSTAPGMRRPFLQPVPVQQQMPAQQPTYSGAPAQHAARAPTSTAAAAQPSARRQAPATGQSGGGGSELAAHRPTGAATHLATSAEARILGQLLGNAVHDPAAHAEAKRSLASKAESPAAAGPAADAAVAAATSSMYASAVAGAALATSRAKAGGEDPLALRGLERDPSALVLGTAPASALFDHYVAESQIWYTTAWTTAGSAQEDAKALWRDVAAMGLDPSSAAGGAPVDKIRSLLAEASAAAEVARAAAAAARAAHSVAMSAKQQAVEAAQQEAARLAAERAAAGAAAAERKKHGRPPKEGKQQGPQGAEGGKTATWQRGAQAGAAARPVGSPPNPPQSSDRDREGEQRFVLAIPAAGARGRRRVLSPGGGEGSRASIRQLTPVQLSSDGTPPTDVTPPPPAATATPPPAAAATKSEPGPGPTGRDDAAAPGGASPLHGEKQGVALASGKRGGRSAGKSNIKVVARAGRRASSFSETAPSQAPTPPAPPPPTPPSPAPGRGDAAPAGGKPAARCPSDAASPSSSSTSCSYQVICKE